MSIYALSHVDKTDRQSINGLLSRTTWVSWHQKGKTILDFNEASQRVAVASAGPYANHLHFDPDRQPRQHLITQFLHANCSSWHPTNRVKAIMQQIMYINSNIFKQNAHFVECRQMCDTRSQIRRVRRWGSERLRGCCHGATSARPYVLDTQILHSAWTRNKEAFKHTFTHTSRVTLYYRDVLN